MSMSVAMVLVVPMVAVTMTVMPVLSVSIGSVVWVVVVVVAMVNGCGSSGRARYWDSGVCSCQSQGIVCWIGYCRHPWLDIPLNAHTNIFLC